MATLIELVAGEALVRVDPQLGPREMEVRCVYVFPHVGSWIVDVLPTLESTWKIDTTPLEQLDTLIAEFCSGEPLQIDFQLKCLRPVGNGMWELKTADLRLFGFFNRQDCFICTDADSAQRTKDFNLYHGYANQGVNRRDTLDLDGPKYLAGDDPNVVVTDWR